MKDAREPRSAPPAWRSPDLEITIGISSCLLGEAVRYDGGHQKDSYVTGALSRHFTWVSVCPEMELGLGAPRETIHLVGDAGAPRLLATQSGTDLTEAMDTYARARVGELGALRLSGYILERASPSCGMERVKVYSDSGVPSRAGRGLFAQRLMDAYPLLPVEEEGRLSDPRLRDNFITRVFAYRRLRALVEEGARPRDIVAFHTAHKLLILAHSPVDYAKLGRLVSSAISRACPTRRGSPATKRASCGRSPSRLPRASTSTCSSTSWDFSSSGSPLAKSGSSVISSRTSPMV
jgi:uncharacterized protein YbbK (DUF523 family)